jgi:predicted permease
MGRVGHDLRSAARSLRRDPAFSLVTGAVLALGMAGNVAAFGLVNAYLVDPLPFPAPDRLMAMRNVVPVPWTEGGEMLEQAVSWDLDAFTLVGPEGPRLVRGAWVAPGFFDAFGIQPALGRAFGPDEAGEGGASVAVISHGLWKTRFGSDPGVVGRTVTTFASDRPEDSETFTVVGVLPADFWFFNRYTEILVPLREENPIYMARLAPGVPVEAAERWLTERARLRAADPSEVRVELEPFADRYTRGVRPTLLLLQGAVLLVLLVACGNGAVLLLVRGAARHREFAVRRALGAGRGRLATQLVAEGLLLAGAAGVAGLLLAGLGLDFGAEILQARLGLSVPGGPEALGVDATVGIVALLVVLVTGVAFGLVPLAAATGGDTRFRVGGRGVTAPRAARRLRSALVGSELALSLALLIAAGLAVRSAVHVSGMELGFDPTRVVTAQVNVRERSYPEAADRVAFFDRLVDEARAIPGVGRAAATVRAPFTWSFGGGVPVEAEGRPVDDRARAPTASIGSVGPGYLDALGIDLVRGRGLAPGDGPGTGPVTVVSESLARTLWPGEDPLGRRLRELPTLGGEAHGQDEPGRWWTVVGVSADVRLSLEGDPVATAWVPYAQTAPTSLTVVMRVRPGAVSPVPELEDIVRRMDPTVAVTSVTDLEDATLEARAPARFLATVLAGFGGFAVLLAVVGLYGVVAYAVAGARRDVAVRMALGARRGQVEGLFVLRGVPVVLAGVVVGIAGGAVLGRTMESRLRGVSASDPATFASLALALAVAALLATWIPARRAARQDPMAVLREE